MFGVVSCGSCPIKPPAARACRTQESAWPAACGQGQGVTHMAHNATGGGGWAVGAKPAGSQEPPHCPCAPATYAQCTTTPIPARPCLRSPAFMPRSARNQPPPSPHTHQPPRPPTISPAPRTHPPPPLPPATPSPPPPPRPPAPISPPHTHTPQQRRRKVGLNGRRRLDERQKQRGHVVARDAALGSQRAAALLHGGVLQRAGLACRRQRLHEARHVAARVGRRLGARRACHCRAREVAVHQAGG